jgi:hypothetical protein
MPNTVGKFSTKATTLLQITLWPRKVVGVSILGFPNGSPRTKCHLDAGPVANHRVYYKGEGGGFPKLGPW